MTDKKIYTPQTTLFGDVISDVDAYAWTNCMRNKEKEEKSDKSDSKHERKEQRVRSNYGW